MTKLCMITAVVMCMTVPVLAETPAVSHYDRSDFLTAPAATFKNGLLGFTNPATLSFLDRPQTQFHWSTDAQKLSTFNNWGFYTAAPHIGFGVQRHHRGDLNVTDYQFSLGFGNRVHASGLSYGWSSGDTDSLGGQRTVQSAIALRPVRFLSLGVTGRFGLQTGTQEWVGEIGLRPLGTPRLTLFADAAWRKRVRLEDIPWSAGAALQLAPGIDVTGRYFENESFTLGLTINFGKSHLASQSHFDADQEYRHQTYSVRSGGMQPSAVATTLGGHNRYLPLAPRGRLTYQQYALFDENTRFLDLLDQIRAATSDTRVTTLAINLSTVQMAPEHAWEVREALKAARAAGKMVITFFELGNMTNYHLASVADRVVMDPQGLMLLEGYAMDKTYLTGMLAKLGLAFDEWRFFKYKSAAEVLSRTAMSDADREQYQAYVDDWYELTRADICASRSLSTSDFDRLIDEEMIFMPEAAITAGLVDTLARWPDLGDIIRRWTGQSARSIDTDELYQNYAYVDQWGPRPKIAVVYGLGECAMETGIRARWLSRTISALARDRTVDAVVFRVDSPGGDGMASDLVAEALKACSKRKPVIVSQGQVAGSGGYWISMYGDTIVAGPNTVTGSIGVIGGWLYDDGFGDKTGLTADFVQRGKHADINAGLRVPILGVEVPVRNLTDEERARIEVLFHDMYDGFIGKVARGRGLSTDSVRVLAEGHFYSGVDGKAIGLVDEIGGLLTAIAIARNKAGLADDADFELVEYPRYRGFFKMPGSRLPVAAQFIDEPVVRFIQMAAERNGRPLPMLAPGSYPTAE